MFVLDTSTDIKEYKRVYNREIIMEKIDISAESIFYDIQRQLINALSNV